MVGASLAAAAAALALQQTRQEVDVAHGQPQDLVLAQLLLGRVRGDELAQLGEGAVDVVLAPALARVGEHLPGHDGRSGETGWLLCEDHKKLLFINSLNLHIKRRFPIEIPLLLFFFCINI